MTITKTGRRFYLTDLPYSLRHEAKSRGCRWDPDARAWWTGKQDVADEIHSRFGDAKPAPRTEITGRDLRVIGRADYKGRTYLLVREGQTRYGYGHKLAFRDGSKVFWAKGDVRVTKRYEEPMTVGAIQDFADRMRAERENDSSYDSGYDSAGAGRLVGYHGNEHCSCGNWSGVGSPCLYSYGEAKAEGEHRSIRWERE